MLKVQTSFGMKTIRKSEPPLLCVLRIFRRGPCRTGLQIGRILFNILQVYWFCQSTTIKIDTDEDLAGTELVVANSSFSIEDVAGQGSELVINNIQGTEESKTESTPGEKNEDGNNSLVYILIAAGAVVIIGVVVAVIVSKKKK